MGNIKPALTPQNLSVGDRVWNKDSGMGFGLVRSVTENRIDMEMDNGSLIEVEVTNNATLEENLQEWTRSINPVTVKVGDRAYQVQQHTGLVFQATVVSIVPDEEIVLEFDDPNRPATKIKAAPITLTQKLMHWNVGEPKRSEFIHFSHLKFDTLVADAHRAAEQLVAEGLNISSDEKWNAQQMDNLVESIVRYVAHNETATKIGFLFGGGVGIGIHYHVDGDVPTIDKVEIR